MKDDKSSTYLAADISKAKTLEAVFLSVCIPFILNIFAIDTDLQRKDWTDIIKYTVRLTTHFPLEQPDRLFNLWIVMVDLWVLWILWLQEYCPRAAHKQIKTLTIGSCSGKEGKHTLLSCCSLFLMLKGIWRGKKKIRITPLLYKKAICWANPLNSDFLSHTHRGQLSDLYLRWLFLPAGYNEHNDSIIIIGAQMRNEWGAY